MNKLSIILDLRAQVSLKKCLIESINKEKIAIKLNVRELGL